jgi:hypothetical protein
VRAGARADLPDRPGIVANVRVDRARPTEVPSPTAANVRVDRARPTEVPGPTAADGPTELVGQTEAPPQTGADGQTEVIGSVAVEMSPAEVAVATRRPPVSVAIGGAAAVRERRAARTVVAALAEGASRRAGQRLVARASPRCARTGVE